MMMMNIKKKEKHYKKEQEQEKGRVNADGGAFDGSDREGPAAPHG